MGILSLDNEFMNYWLRLSSSEKASLLTIAKQYVGLKEESGHVSIEQYNKEIDEAMSSMDDGEVISFEQVVKDSESWLNGRQVY